MQLIFHGHNENSTCSYKEDQEKLIARHGVPFFIVPAWGRVLLNDSRFQEVSLEDKDVEKIDKTILVRSKVVMMTNVAIGDNLMAIPAILEYLRLNPGTDVIIVTEEKHRCIWSQYGSRIEFMDIMDYSSNFSKTFKGQKIMIRDRESQHTQDKTRNRCLNIADIVRVPLKLEQCNVFNWNKQSVKQLKNIKHPIGIQLRSADPGRSWDTSFKKQRELCSKLVEDGLTPVLFDVKEQNLNWKGCKDLTGKLNECDYINAIASCEYVIVFGDTGAEHIAGSLEIPFLCMFGKGYRPESRLNHYKQWDCIYKDDLKKVTVDDIYHSFKTQYNTYVKDKNKDETNIR
jgi:ADP-heptose:LPS heptosyltransferase